MSSVPSEYLCLCARRKIGFNKKIHRKLLDFVCTTNQPCAQHWPTMGWRNLSKTVGKKLLQPTLSSVSSHHNALNIPFLNLEECSYPAHQRLVCLSVRQSDNLSVRYKRGDGVKECFILWDSFTNTKGNITYSVYIYMVEVQGGNLTFVVIQTTRDKFICQSVNLAICL